MVASWLVLRQGGLEAFELTSRFEPDDWRSRLDLSAADVGVGRRGVAARGAGRRDGCRGLAVGEVKRRRRRITTPQPLQTSRREGQDDARGLPRVPQMPRPYPLHGRGHPHVGAITPFVFHRSGWGRTIRVSRWAGTARRSRGRGRRHDQTRSSVRRGRPRPVADASPHASQPPGWSWLSPRCWSAAGSVAVVGTNVVAHRAQSEEVVETVQDWDHAETAVRTTIRRAPRPAPATGTEPAVVRIPRFGASYAVPIHPGVGDDVLARGFGHFEFSAAPGGWGNYALAAHRVTHGEPLRHVLDLRPGDRVTISTRHWVFTYRLDTDPRRLRVTGRGSGSSTSTPSTRTRAVSTPAPASGCSRWSPARSCSTPTTGSSCSATWSARSGDPERPPQIARELTEAPAGGLGGSRRSRHCHPIVPILADETVTAVATGCSADFRGSRNSTPPHPHEHAAPADETTVASPSVLSGSLGSRHPRQSAAKEAGTPHRHCSRRAVTVTNPARLVVNRRSRGVSSPLGGRPREVGTPRALRARLRADIKRDGGSGGAVAAALECAVSDRHSSCGREGRPGVELGAAGVERAADGVHGVVAQRQAQRWLVIGECVMMASAALAGSPGWEPSIASTARR